MEYVEQRTAKAAQQKAAKNEKKETRNDRKRHKNEFSCFLSRNTNTIVTHAHSDTRTYVEWCMKNIYLGKEWNKHSSSSSPSFFVLSACCLFSLNLHSVKSFISNGRRENQITDDPDNIVTFVNPQWSDLLLENLSIKSSVTQFPDDTWRLH